MEEPQEKKGKATEINENPWRSYKKKKEEQQKNMRIHGGATRESKEKQQQTMKTHGGATRKRRRNNNKQ